jgi:hypothetical protein
MPDRDASHRPPDPPSRTTRGDVPVPLPVHRAADAPPPLDDVEVTLSVHADGRQIAVRRSIAADAGARRTVHIDAVVRG